MASSVAPAHCPRDAPTITKPISTASRRMVDVHGIQMVELMQRSLLVALVEIGPAAKPTITPKTRVQNKLSYVMAQRLLMSTSRILAGAARGAQLTPKRCVSFQSPAKAVAGVSDKLWTLGKLNHVAIAVPDLGTIDEM